LGIFGEAALGTGVRLESRFDNGAGSAIFAERGIILSCNTPEGTKTKAGSRMEITLTVPEELASRLRPVEDHLPQILELGMREWQARSEAGFSGLADVLETLASLPTPEEILALRPAATLQERIEKLLEKNQAGGMSPEEQREWEQYQYVEHLVRLAKARAALKLKSA
jgi:hypothetical protein